MSNDKARNAEDRARVGRAIPEHRPERVTNLQWNALLLWVSGLTFAQIATILGVTRQRAGTLARDARKNMVAR